MKTEYKYKGYHIFVDSFKPRRYRVVSYSKDFTPKTFSSLIKCKKFIDKILGVD